MIRIARALHKVYKLTISKVIGQRCRFHPSCSDYCIEALETHGFIKGSLLAVKRILRCNPLSSGWFDPVPAKGSKRKSLIEVK